MLRRIGPVLTVLLALAWSRDGFARAKPERHETLRPSYILELEPQFLLGTWAPNGRGVGPGLGFGARASWELAPEGLSTSLDDSLAVTLGVGFVHYPGRGGVYDTCLRWEPTPAGTRVCTDLPGSPRNYVFLPLQAQWNVWLNPRWSVLVEPGLAFSISRGQLGLAPAFDIGGRYQIRDLMAIVVRLGWPTASLGVAFQL